MLLMWSGERTESSDISPGSIAATGSAMLARKSKIFRLRAQTSSGCGALNPGPGSFARPEPTRRTAPQRDFRADGWSPHSVAPSFDELLPNSPSPPHSSRSLIRTCFTIDFERSGLSHPGRVRARRQLKRGGPTYIV